MAAVEFRTGAGWGFAKGCWEVDEAGMSDDMLHAHFMNLPVACYRECLRSPATGLCCGPRGPGKVDTRSQAVDLGSAVCALELVSISWQEAYCWSRGLLGVEVSQQMRRGGQNALSCIGKSECGREGGAGCWVPDATEGDDAGGASESRCRRSWKEQCRREGWKLRGCRAALCATEGDGAASAEESIFEVQVGLEGDLGGAASWA